MANVRRRATSRANSSDNDFSIGKDINIPSLVRGTKQDSHRECFNTWQRRKLEEGSGQTILLARRTRTM
jgi:hypothetical protein